MADQWDRRFDDHPVWGAVVTLKDHLSKIDLPSDPQLAESYRRLERLVATLDAYREAENNKDLFTNTMLQSVYDAMVQYVLNMLSQYVQDPATYAGSLTSAADNVDTVHEQLARWPALSLRGRAVAAGQAAGQYEDASKEALARFSVQVEEIGEKVTGLRARIDDEVEQVQQVRSEAIQELQTNVDTHLTSVKEQVVEIENAVSGHLKTLENLTDKTEESLKDRLAEFGEWSRTEAADSIREAINELREDTAKSVAETKAALEETKRLHNETAELEKQTRNTAEALAQRAVADDYQKNARNKAFAGWVWDVLGFVVGAVPLGFVLYHFLTVTDNTDNLAALTVSRVGVSAAAVGVAALCFHRGSQNHKESRIAKRTDLRVRTVRPFLANLEPDVRDAVIEGMADQLYLQGKMETLGPQEGAEAEENLLARYLKDRRLRTAITDGDTEGKAET
ncbi:hypothetical protein [Mycolicibacterium lutetiense]|uniref:Gas vesicle protein n=1 Tax=Mycolicibacterium lutetiense TaxID=1641992 RepID=A0ABS4ZYN5_9MYCO|nr:hypothetical protein [Mycolicibacterium lutetiense]MBP2454624.1 gas vesicle protein [Mycolicibacterium lutetiense]